MNLSGAVRADGSLELRNDSYCQADDVDDYAARERADDDEKADSEGSRLLEQLGLLELAILCQKRCVLPTIRFARSRVEGMVVVFIAHQGVWKAFVVTVRRENC